AGAGDDVHPGVAVGGQTGGVGDDARRNEHAAGKVRVVGVEPVPQARVLLNPVRDAVPDLHVRTAAGPGAGDDVVGAVAVHIAHRHPDAAREVDVVRHEVPEDVAVGAREHAHLGRTARGAR